MLHRQLGRDVATMQIPNGSGKYATTHNVLILQIYMEKIARMLQQGNAFTVLLDNRHTPSNYLSSLRAIFHKANMPSFNLIPARVKPQKHLQAQKPKLRFIQ